MNIVISLLHSIAYTAVSTFSLILLIYCVSSWFIRDPFNKFMQFLETILGPVLNPIRDFLNRFSFFRNLPLDLSVLIAFLLCDFIIALL